MTNVIDPLDFAVLSAQQARIELPIQGEVKHARRGLAELYSLFYDCPIFNQLTPRQRRSYVRRWIGHFNCLIQTEGFVAALVRLAKLGNEFLHAFVWKDGRLTYEEPDSLNGWIFYNLSGYVMLYLTQGRIDEAINLVRWVNSACNLLSKLPISRPDLEIQGRSEWVQRQSIVKGTEDFRADLVEEMRTVVSYLFDETSHDIHEGKHGPGSTATRAKTIPEKEDQFVHCIQSAEITSYRLDGSTLRRYPLEAVLQQVPKDMKSLRPITMESVSMQFAQQKLKRFMYENVDQGNVMASNYIKFADQKPSQRLALIGSRKGFSDSKPVTLDLSSASDLLSSDLVSSVFSGDLLHLIMCSRTWNVQTDVDTTVEVKMFAGMGSAVTFPVQTIVFTAMSLLATCKSVFRSIFGREPEHMEAVREFLAQDMRRQSDVYKYFRNIRVYGDDIIIPAIATTEMFFLLEHFGLVVNRNKSFYGNSAVREACGIYALAGRDITPVRFRVPYWDRLADFAVYDSLRQHVNLAFIRCYSTLYRMRMRVFKDLKVFIARSDRKRNTVSISERGKRISSARLGDISIPFEEFRGDDADYIGVLSSRRLRDEGDRAIIFGESRRILTTYASKAKTEKTDNHEEYYLLQDLYKRSRKMEHSQSLLLKGGESWKIPFLCGTTQLEITPEASHGLIPRGIRLVKRIVYRRSDGQGWAWVPGQG